MSKYRWDSPGDWLLEKAEQHAKDQNTAELLSILQSLVGDLDSDTIQDIFQQEMEEDGYFDKLVSEDDVQGCVGKLIMLSYECHENRESGETEGVFTGERDTWGRWTFQVEDGGTPLGTMYLFTSEVRSLQEVPR